jgi:L-ribulokinase
VIDSHVALPAVGAYGPGVLVGALGTSAAYLLLDNGERQMPAGVEGRAYGAALPGLWCYEAGQAAFGDVLAWFVRAFPRSNNVTENFARYNREAAALAPGQNGLVAVDWWNGNRVPYADKALRGLIAGFDMSTTAVDIYRALMDSICFGARSIIDRFRCGGMPVERIVLTSGLAKSNPFLLTVMPMCWDRLCTFPRSRIRPASARRSTARSPLESWRIFEKARTGSAPIDSTSIRPIRNAKRLTGSSITAIASWVPTRPFASPCARMV